MKPIYRLDLAYGSLAAQLLSSATGNFQINSLNQAGAQSWNATSGYYILVTIEDEQILCSAMSVSGGVATLTIATGGRGYNNTTAATHASGTEVDLSVQKQHVDELQNEVLKHITGLASQEVAPTITNATTLSFAAVDYTTKIIPGMTILIKISSTWHRCTVKAVSFSTNTTVTVTSDTLPSSGTVADWGLELFPSSFKPIEYTKLKEVSNVPATPASGYGYIYAKAKSVFYKDSDGLIRYHGKVNGTAASSSGALSLDALAANVYDVTLTENVTSIAITGGTSLGDGELLILRLKQHASSAKTVVPGTGSFMYSSDITGFTMSTTVAYTDVLTLQWSTTLAKWLLVAVNQGFH